jgi:hypothetical protein
MLSCWAFKDRSGHELVIAEALEQRRLEVAELAAATRCEFADPRQFHAASASPKMVSEDWGTMAEGEVDAARKANSGDGTKLTGNVRMLALPENSQGRPAWPVG